MSNKIEQKIEYQDDEERIKIQNNATLMLKQHIKNTKIYDEKDEIYKESSYSFDILYFCTTLLVMVLILMYVVNFIKI
jgi:hypothetical protein